MPVLVKFVPDKIADMNEQHLANCFLAAAKLQDESPVVLDVVPALAECIPPKVDDMIPQALANCLWAAEKLQDASPEVLHCVPALAQQIPGKVQSMTSQELSNCFLNGCQAPRLSATGVGSCSSPRESHARGQRPDEFAGFGQQLLGGSKA